MTDTTMLVLNDFASFDRAIFNDMRPVVLTKRAWRSATKDYYNENIGRLTLPIDHAPVTIEEHQFCHYVLWMTIWSDNLFGKPITLCYKDTDGNITPLRILNECFACHYRRYSDCPIKKWQPCKCLGLNTLYSKWNRTRNSEAAYKIAHLEWEDVNQ